MLSWAERGSGPGFRLVLLAHVVPARELKERLRVRGPLPLLPGAPLAGVRHQRPGNHERDGQFQGRWFGNGEEAIPDLLTVIGPAFGDGQRRPSREGGSRVITELARHPDIASEHDAIALQAAPFGWEPRRIDQAGKLSLCFYREDVRQARCPLSESITQPAR